MVVANTGGGSTRVRTPHTTRLAALIGAAGGSAAVIERNLLTATGITAPRIAELAASHALLVFELVPRPKSLEEVDLAPTLDDVGCRSGRTTEAATR